MAMSVYAGTTLSETEKIIAGDYSAFDSRERATYSRVYLGHSTRVQPPARASRI